MKTVDIAPGVKGLFIKNDRFSTTHISVNLYTPLNEENIAANALLPYLLSSCCARFPSLTDLNLELSRLYGADVGGIADKVGDTQVLRFFSYCVDDEYLPGEEAVAAQAAELLFSIIFEPSVKDGAFLQEDLERERRLTLEKIAGIVNDKRTYAITRIIAEMYKDQPFGLLKTGTPEAVCALTGGGLLCALKELLSKAEIRVQVIGKRLPDGLFEELARRLQTYTAKREPLAPAKPKTPSDSVNRITEEMEVAQGKLVMGFCTEAVGEERQTAYLAVFADLFGGGPYSKLFTNVREKLSLCYYCAARANRAKGYLLVDCGVEPQNAEKAEQEILNQLSALQRGDFTEEELSASLRSIKESLSGINDSQAALDGWYAMRPFGEPLSPEEYADCIAKITRQDIIRAAGLYKLDTVYKILPATKKEA